jgi:hypothetical protein
VVCSEVCLFRYVGVRGVVEFALAVDYLSRVVRSAVVRGVLRGLTELLECLIKDWIVFFGNVELDFEVSDDRHSSNIESIIYILCFASGVNRVWMCILSQKRRASSHG